MIIDAAHPLHHIMLSEKHAWEYVGCLGVAQYHWSHYCVRGVGNVCSQDYPLLALVPGCVSICLACCKCVLQQKDQCRRVELQ